MECTFTYCRISVFAARQTHSPLLGICEQNPPTRSRVVKDSWDELLYMRKISKDVVHYRSAILVWEWNNTRASKRSVDDSQALWLKQERFVNSALI